MSENHFHFPICFVFFATLEIQNEIEIITNKKTYVTEAPVKTMYRANEEAQRREMRCKVPKSATIAICVISKIKKKKKTFGKE